MLFKFEHPSNVRSFISSTPFGMFIFANLLQFKNAFAPIVLIVSGKYTTTQVYAFQKPSSAIVVTVFPSNVEGITIYRARPL